MEEVIKSYNPFKMWGSWVGLVVVIIAIFSILFSNCSGNYFPDGKEEFFQVSVPGFQTTCVHVVTNTLKHCADARPRFIGEFDMDNCLSNPDNYQFTGSGGDGAFKTLGSFLIMVIIWILILGAIGFLFGWVIHSLIRKYKN